MVDVVARDERVHAGESAVGARRTDDGGAQGREVRSDGARRQRREMRPEPIGVSSTTRCSTRRRKARLATGMTARGASGPKPPPADTAARRCQGSDSGIDRLRRSR
nr:hypothetical protein GCM10025699_70000 [Microbacterium flavescens]